MNILQINSRVPFPPTSGGVIYTNIIAKGYLAANQNLTLFCLNTKKHFFDINQLPQHFLKGVKAIHTSFVDTDIKPFDAIYNLLFSNQSYNITRFYSKKVEKDLVNLLKANVFDVVHLDTLYTTPYVACIRRFAPRAKIVYVSQNVESVIWERLSVDKKNATWLQKIKNRYFKLLAKRLKSDEKKVFEQVDGVCAITEIDSKLMEQLGCKKPMWVVPFGIFMTDAKPDFSLPQSHQICFIASLDWLPNVEGLLWFLDNVWCLVKAQKPDLRCLVAGKSMPKNLKNKQIAGVEMVGEVADAQRFIQESGILIVPLLSGSGMRIKILEGMALGKAIVSTSVGAEGIGVQNHHDICVADTPEDFAKNLLELINDEGKCVEMGKNARQNVEKNYDFRLIVHQLLVFYSNI